MSHSVLTVFQFDDINHIYYYQHQIISPLRLVLVFHLKMLF